MPVPQNVMIIFWIVAAVLFLIVEAATVGLASIWFALGALAALVCALLKGPLWLQILWFFVISVVTLLITRPLAKRYVNGRRQATNADRCIGAVAVVTQQVDNIAGTGARPAGREVLDGPQRHRGGIPRGSAGNRDGDPGRKAPCAA